MLIFFKGKDFKAISHVHFPNGWIMFPSGWIGFPTIAESNSPHAVAALFASAGSMGTPARLSIGVFNQVDRSKHLFSIGSQIHSFHDLVHFSYYVR